MLLDKHYDGNVNSSGSLNQVPLFQGFFHTAMNRIKHLNRW